MRLLILNGPNLNLIGQREEEIYGDVSFEAFFKSLQAKYPEISLDYYQSNVEGEIINTLQSSGHDGILLNAGGYTHTSVAIHDCIRAIRIPVLEIHISNIAGREKFRHESLISPVAIGCLFGLGLEGYALGIDYFNNYLNKR